MPAGKGSLGTSGHNGKTGRFSRAKIAALAVAVVIPMVLFLLGPDGVTVGYHTFSLTLQSGAPGSYGGQGWWIEEVWDAPTGESGHGQIYGIQFGNRLLLCNITYDPVSSIKRRLPRTVPGLIGMLEHGDHFVKQCAGEELVSRGPAAAAALPELLRHQARGDEMLADYVIQISRAAKAEAIPWLLPVLNDQDSAIRQKAAEAVGEIGPDAIPAIPALVKALGDPVPAVVMASALSLHKIEAKDHGEIPVLTGLLNHNDAETRNGAVSALGEFGAEASIAVPPLIELLESGKTDTGLTARTLGLIGPAATPVVPRLIQLLDTRDRQSLRFIIEALGNIGEPAKAAIPRLLQLAERRETAWSAISALSFMGEDAAPGLIDLYKHSEVGFLAARALKQLAPRGAAAVAVLLADLESESPIKQTLAAMALGSLGENAKKATGRLAELTQNADPRVRIRAAEALWNLDRRTNAVLAVMVAELQDWSQNPRALREQTADTFGECRQQIAARILGEIGPPARQAVPLLQMMQRSSIDSQKESATRALEHIGGLVTHFPAANRR